MAFPTTTVLDAFTGAGPTNPPSANWTEYSDYGGLYLYQNQVISTSPSGVGFSGWNPATYTNSEAYVTWATVGTEISVYGRVSYLGGSISSFDGYRVKATATTIAIGRWDNAVETVLASASGKSYAAGVSIGIEIIGTTIKAYSKASGGSWVEELSTTDSAYASGYIGMLIGGYNTDAGDNFGGGAVVAAASIIPLIMETDRRFRS